MNQTTELDRAAPGRPQCRCGYHRDHHMVSPVPTYSGWGKFWVFFVGVSTRPLRIQFRCRICKTVFDSIDDPKELDRFI